MYQLSHRKLDKKEVTEITIGTYINNLKQQRGNNDHSSHNVLLPLGLTNENKRNQFQEELNCVRSAWTLVKERLKDYGRG